MINKELRDKKVSLINDFQRDHREEIELLYHGIPLLFKSKNPQLSQDLREKLPENWFKKSQAPITIYISSPLEYSLNGEQWCDEFSQDCEILREQSIVIHRDFVAKHIKNSYHLICEDKLGDGLYNFLRWLLPKLLLKESAYVLHSSCIINHDNKAYFFLGHSGAGKTTISTHSPGKKILGDDMNLLYYREKKASAGAIGGLIKRDVDYNDKFNIKGFFWLKQASENKLTRMSKARAQSKLVASITNIFWDKIEEKEIQNIFFITHEFVSNYPCYELEFKKDDSFWDVINESL